MKDKCQPSNTICPHENIKTICFRQSSNALHLVHGVSTDIEHPRKVSDIKRTLSQCPAFTLHYLSKYLKDFAISMEIIEPPLMKQNTGFTPDIVGQTQLWEGVGSTSLNKRAPF